MADIQNLKNEFEDDELKALIADSMSQTFSSENISVSEDLISKTLGRIKALPVNEVPVVSAEELEAKRREKNKKRNRIVASLSTVAAALVIGLIGINFIGSTKESAMKSESTYGGFAESALEAQEPQTSLLSKPRENLSARNETADKSAASDFFAADAEFTESKFLAAGDSIEYAEEDGAWMDTSCEPEQDCVGMPFPETMFNGSELPVITAESEISSVESTEIENSVTSDFTGNGCGSVSVYEIEEAEFPEKYRELSLITEEIISLNPRTEEKNTDDVSLIMTLTADNGASLVYNFGNGIVSETEYSADGENAGLTETYYYVPELDEYMENIYTILNSGIGLSD